MLRKTWPIPLFIQGTVLIQSAAELQKFSQGEESHLEDQIKSIAETGSKVIVSGGKFGEMALHFLNKYGIMAVRLLSKFDLRRLCRTIGATALPRLVSFKLESVLLRRIWTSGCIIFLFTFAFVTLDPSYYWRIRILR